MPRVFNRKPKVPGVDPDTMKQHASDPVIENQQQPLPFDTLPSSSSVPAMSLEEKVDIMARKMVELQQRCTANFNALEVGLDGLVHQMHHKFLDMEERVLVNQTGVTCERCDDQACAFDTLQAEISQKLHRVNLFLNSVGDVDGADGRSRLRKLETKFEAFRHDLATLMERVNTLENDVIFTHAPELPDDRGDGGVVLRRKPQLLEDSWVCRVMAMPKDERQGFVEDYFTPLIETQIQFATLFEKYEERKGDSLSALDFKRIKRAIRELA